MLETPETQGGPSRGDPPPPPPSPIVIHTSIPTSSDSGDAMEAIKAATTIITSIDPSPLPQTPPQVIDTKASTNATLNLLQATSVTLTQKFSDGVFSTSPRGETSVKNIKDESDVAIGETFLSEIFEDKNVASASPQPLPVEEETRPGQYRLKWIKFKGNKLPIITQNENGPCPLIAIMNVLLLKGRLRLPSVMEIITAEQLMEYLGDCILASLPKNLNEGQQLNFEQNMMDAIAILPKLQTGLDVNVRFTSISDFEFTSELIVFDLLHIPLYHGWLVDPLNCRDMAQAIGSCSYNQLVDKIINHKTSIKPELVTEALLAEEFLESTASQLTYYGLEELICHVKSDDPCVLFRNNHFITLYKHNKQLYQLVTDQGFLSEGNVIWETLNNIEGDGRFVDEEFQIVPPKVQAPLLSLEEMKMQEDQDYLIALSLQEEYKKEAEQSIKQEWEDAKLGELTDEELAKRLQMQEDARCQKLQQQQQLQHRESPAVGTYRPPSSHSTSRESPHRHMYEESYGDMQSSAHMPKTSYHDESLHKSVRSQPHHHYQVQPHHHQTYAIERPSSASSQGRTPPRKSTSLIESSERSHQIPYQPQPGQQQQQSHQHHKRSSERHHSDHDSRGSGHRNKSNCSIM